MDRPKPNEQRCYRESYTSSTRFFHIQLSLFEIRTNNYSPWIQLNPSFFSLTPPSSLSPAPPARRAAPAPCVPRGPACLRVLCRPRAATASRIARAPADRAGLARYRGPRTPHAPRRLPRATHAARSPRRRQLPAPEKKTEEKIFVQHFKNWFNIFEMLVQHF